MSFNDWISSSTVSRQPLSTINFNDVKQSSHHYHYHYHYAPPILYPSYPCCQHRCHKNRENFDSYAIVPSRSIINQQIRLKYHENLQRNSIIKLNRCVNLFLQLIDNTSISEFLQHDIYYQHADKYLLAMALLYFWRAKLREHHYTKDSFYLALWLAHDSVEEDLTSKYGLLPWALQTYDEQPSNDLKNDFKRFLTKKNDLWTRMGFRTRVTKEECDQIMLIQPNHWIWKRERSINYNQIMSTMNQQRKNDLLKNNNSCSSQLSISPVDDPKSIINIDDINRNSISWTTDYDSDEILSNNSDERKLPLNQLSMDTFDDEEDC